MANLTDQLAGVNSGKQIVQPGPAEPSVFGALANFAANSVGGLARLGEASARDRQEKEAKDALNASAQAQFDIRQQATQNTLSQDFSERIDTVSAAAGAFGTGVPGDVQGRVRELTRSLKGVAQGRVPQDRYDLQLEAAQAELFAKYPDQRAAIAQHFQGAGLDHFMFRAINEDKKAYDAEQAAQTGAITSQFQYAADRGLVTDQTDLEGGARVGRQAMADAARLKAAQDAAEAARADRTLSIQERESRLKEASTETTAALISQVSTGIIPLVDQLSLALSAAGTDTDRQTKLADYRIRTQAYLTSAKVRAIASAPDASAREALTSFYDSQIESLDSLFTNSFETNGLAMKNLQAGFNITAAQAMPAYHTLVAALGQPAVNAAFADPTGQIKLPPEVTAAISKEMNNFNPADPRGAVSLSRMIGYLRGQTGLEDLTAEQASQYVRTNSTIQQANQAALLGGNSSVATNFLANAANTAEAMVEIPPTTQDVASLRIATNLNATPQFRTALREAEKVDPEYARSVATASRNGSAKAMIAARNNLNDGPFVARYNEGSGRYEATLTRESYNRWAGNRGGQLGGGGVIQMGGTRANVPSFEQMRSRIPANLATRVHVLNQNLDHLVETRGYDPTVSNLSPRDTRRLFAQGRMPSTGGAAGDASPNADAEFGKLLDGLDIQLQQLITSTTSRPLPDLRRGLIRSESGGDLTALNSEGYGGRLQFGATRLADAARAGLVPSGTTGAQFAQMSEAEQQKVEDWHFEDIDRQSQRAGLNRYYGQTVAGVPINENSIRAMAHLGGLDGARRFIETNGQYNPADSNGTKLSDYGRRFG